MLMILPSFLVFMNWLPEKYVTAANNFYGESGVEFQIFFICLLMMGALLAIDRKMLVKSLIRYIPTVIAGVVVAGLFGTVAGMLMGCSLTDIWVLYVFPIMGGGNGGGAIPMSQIYEQVTGQNKDNFHAVALAILTFANSLCIIVAALLNKLGLMFSKLTGDGTNIMRSAEAEDVRDKEKENIKPTMEEIACGILATGALYTVARIISKVLLPTIFGIAIHQYAYFVLLLTVVNITGILPDRFTAGVRYLQRFLTGALGPMGLCAVGITMMDFGEFMNAITIQNLILALAIVIGAVVGTAVVGYFFGFYPIDSAMTAGLCMANRGGGDLAVLAAGKRMNLITYAAISSRLGGGLVLAAASIVFSILLK